MKSMPFAGVSTSIIALGLATCSMPVKILEAEIPPDQDMNCDALTPSGYLHARPNMSSGLKLDEGIFR